MVRKEPLVVLLIVAMAFSGCATGETRGVLTVRHMVFGSGEPIPVVLGWTSHEGFNENTMRVVEYGNAIEMPCMVGRLHVAHAGGTDHHVTSCGILDWAVVARHQDTQLPKLVPWELGGPLCQNYPNVWYDAEGEAQGACGLVQGGGVRE